MCRRLPGQPGQDATREDTLSGGNIISNIIYLCLRLCKLGPQGRPGITEECFASNVLEFATNFTMIAGGNGRENGTFEKFEQTDLSEGTYPVGSVWRPIGKVFPTPLSKYWHVLRSDTDLIYFSKLHCSYVRKDTVRIPANLPEGDYVLGWRWDVENGNQVCDFFRIKDFGSAMFC